MVSFMLDFDPETLPYYDPQKQRKVALVTGGNSGIGWFTVLHLYLHGFVVYVAGRSPARVQRSLEEIRKEASRRNSAAIEEALRAGSGQVREQHLSDDAHQQRYTGKLVAVEIDLLDLGSVERAAELLKRTENRLDLVVCNAGVMALPHALTKDGFEVQFQTNYVAHFLLTQRLLPLLMTGDSRVVFVSSIGHRFEVFPFSRDWTFNYAPNLLFTWLRYAMAKTSAIQYIRMLALKHPEIHCFAVHPGFVMNTNLFSHWTRLPIVGVFFWLFFQVFGFFFGCSNEEGAYATLKCSLSNEVLLNENGSYFITNGKLAQPSRVASNVNASAKNWVWTIQQLRKRGFDNLD